MRIRFLQTVPSTSPDYPFVAGQIIQVTDPPPEWILALVDGVRAEALKDDEAEYATMASPKRLPKKSKPS